MASANSCGVGRSCCMFDQIQQLVLHLGREPAKHCELDAPLLPVEVAPRLGEAAGRPLDVAEDLPDGSSSRVTSSPVSSA